MLSAQRHDEKILPRCVCKTLLHLILQCLHGHARVHKRTRTLALDRPVLFIAMPCSLMHAQKLR